MTIQAELLAEIDDYLRRRPGGLNGPTFGLYAVNDGKFYGRLALGGNITIATVEKVRRYMADNPVPGSAPVRRPKKGKAA